MPLHAATINRVIDMMHDQVGGNTPMAEFARVAHMSPRLFRKAFQEVTGVAPKAFYDGLRLGIAREWLQLRVCNVSETAERLGFSSPYHFSKAFRKRFGHAPSALWKSGE